MRPRIHPLKRCAVCDKRLDNRNITGLCSAHITARTDARNERIAKEYKAGDDIDVLAARYGVHKYQIRVILRRLDSLPSRAVTCDPLYPSRALKVAAEAVAGRADELKLPVQKRPYVHARWAVMAAMNRHGITASSIGRRLNRDHTTVLYGLRQAEMLASQNLEFAALIERIVAA